MDTRQQGEDRKDVTADFRGARPVVSVEEAAYGSAVAGRHLVIVGATRNCEAALEQPFADTVLSVETDTGVSGDRRRGTTTSATTRWPTPRPSTTADDRTSVLSSAPSHGRAAGRPFAIDSDGQEPTDVDDTVAADASGLGPTVATPLDASQLTRMIATLDLDTLTVKCDWALLLFGFAGAVRRTKDDQEALGRDVGVPAFPGSPLCPVTAVDAR